MRLHKVVVFDMMMASIVFGGLLHDIQVRSFLICYLNHQLVCCRLTEKLIGLLSYAVIYSLWTEDRR